MCVKLLDRTKSLLLAAALILVAASCSHPSVSGSRDNPEGEKTLDNLYAEVDGEIDRSSIYIDEKEKRINLLKHSLASVRDNNDRLHIYDNLINEYEAYVCDSALKFVEGARQLAVEIKDPREETRLLIKKADIASHAGLFTEARDMLASVNRAYLDSTLMPGYYAAYCVLYQYESEYLPAGEYTHRSRRLRHQYSDSLLNVTPEGTFVFLSTWADENIETNTEAVRDSLEKALKTYVPGNRQYSIISSILARVYGKLGDEDRRSRYLAETVISDIKGAVKENMAMRELATKVFEDGDIERANHYMKVSLDDAYFYSSSLSNAQSSRMLPVIDKAYDRTQKRQQMWQKALICVTSILLLLEAFGLVVIIRQARRRKEASRRISESNEELSEMSEKLRDMNSALEKSNVELKTSNRTAEEYAGLFMEFCSLTISNLQAYHLALRNLALQGNVKGILKKLDTSDATSETLKTFYQKFDDAILNLYPNFADRVNALLTDDGRIILRNGERLNTELRVLALIKIGIFDSEKIAEFLRCSISTIYTYRSKLKRRAINPDEFESQLLEI